MGGFFSFLANNLPLVISMVAGITLLVVEVFMPGFGVAGIAGGALMIASVALVWTDYGVMAGLWMALGTLLLAGIAIMFSLRSASRGEFFRKHWGLKELREPDEENALEAFVGKTGQAVTTLRPSGIGDFDGVRLDVVTQGEYIAQGDAIRIDKTEGRRIIVRKI